MYSIVYSNVHYSQTTPEDIFKMFFGFFCDSKKLCCYLLVFEKTFLKRITHLLSETELCHHQNTTFHYSLHHIVRINCNTATGTQNKADGKTLKLF